MIAAMWNWLIAIFCSRVCWRQSSGALRSGTSAISGGGVLNSRFSASRRSSTGIEAKRSSFSALTIARSRPGLRRVVQENRIDHFARRRRQPERNVRDAQNRLDERNIFLDQPDRFDGLDRAADVILIAGRARKHQRIDDDVLRRNPVFFGQQLDRPLRHRQLPLPRERLRLLACLRRWSRTTSAAP